MSDIDVLKLDASDVELMAQEELGEGVIRHIVRIGEFTFRRNHDRGINYTTWSHEWDVLPNGKAIILEKIFRIYCVIDEKIEPLRTQK